MIGDVLCANCEHSSFDHHYGDGADECELCDGCKFTPLATFAQLKEAWELVGKIQKAKNVTQLWDFVDEADDIINARRIRGGKEEV